MTERTDMRFNEIRRRTEEKKRRRSRAVISGSGIMSLALLLGIGILLGNAGSPGPVQARGGYSSLLLQDGAGAYVVVGIAAFAAGVTVTLICLRARRNRRGSVSHREEESE